MSDDLKPCPFCGKRPKLTVRPDNAEATSYFAAVACFCNGFAACAHKDGIAPEADEAEAKARTAWNTRPAPASPAPGAMPQPIATERERLRNAQAASVMPMIGPLLDAWEGCSQAVKEQHPELYRQLRQINHAMERAGD